MKKMDGVNFIFKTFKIQIGLLYTYHPVLWYKPVIKVNTENFIFKTCMILK